MSNQSDALDPAGSTTWIKSSYSSEAGGNCVEVAHCARPARVAVRDSKASQGPVVLLSQEAFTAFVNSR